MGERAWGGLALVVGLGLLAWMSLNYFKPPVSKSQPVNPDTLDVCWISREDFYPNKQVLELVIEDIKKFGGWNNVNLKISKVAAPRDTGNKILYFFPDKAAADKWVRDRVSENCESGRLALKVVMAGFIEGEDSWGYAKVNEGIAVILQGVVDSVQAGKAGDMLWEAAILHEIGHVWGLNHNRTPGCLMNDEEFGNNDLDKISLSNNFDENFKKELGLTFCQNEIDLLKTIKSPYLNL
ncbi:MAG: hypothetical protein G01um101416_567 [Microgenomates group bacterium Gr01-1014_16]|nr:MAG: hypothetical protein G01um101416_567 [Microgenomates group bacterium Gr01-1014_16]